jgi:transcription termination/antitermination protein NusA
MDSRGEDTAMTAETPFSISSNQHAAGQDLARQDLARQDLARQDPGSKSQAAELALQQALDDIPGIFAAMLAAFGRNGIRTVEDLAACATDDLLGWTERTGDEITTHPGILGDMVVSRKQCDAIILQARIRAGWIEPAALPA